MATSESIGFDPGSGTTTFGSVLPYGAAQV
jgi:hypothetical protein